MPVAVKTQLRHHEKKKPSNAAAAKSKKRSQPEASTSADRSPSLPSRSKRPRKTNTEKASPSEEKRQARFIARPNAAVSERINRALEHRLYLIEKNLAGNPNDPTACNFFVLGATGNVYTVRLDHRPSCTCPDFLRGNTCKHILFVMLRVLKLPRHDPRVWQKALVKSELGDLLHLSSVNEAVLASQRVRARFHEIAGSSPAKEKEQNKTAQRDLEGDCPVCYEPFTGGKEAVVFCRVCGNNLHKDCFMRWSKSKRQGTVTCIYCRAPWEDDGRGKSKSGEMGGAYVNLAAYSDFHRPEDISLEALYPETSVWIRPR